MNGRAFDAQVVLTDKSSPRGQLMSQYVCARITDMRGIDIGLFDFDRHNAIYFFIMDADEHIYMRYGGRDAASADSYLNLRSLELALQKGLELHDKRRRNPDKDTADRPQALFPRDIPLLAERTVDRGSCVECHLISDYENLHREQQGSLSKSEHMYRSPDIKDLGIELDVPKGLVVKSAAGAAGSAGMRPGDTIVSFSGNPVWTFGDLQFRYDKLDRAARWLSLSVRREGQTIDLRVELPALWWKSDLSFRHWSVDPVLYFHSVALTGAERLTAGLAEHGFASRVDEIDVIAELQGNHELQVGDVIYSVDGVEQDPIATTADLYIKLRHDAGDTVRLGVVRAGKRIELKLETERLEFRK